MCVSLAVSVKHQKYDNYLHFEFLVSIIFLLNGIFMPLKDNLIFKVYPWVYNNNIQVSVHL